MLEIVCDEMPHSMRYSGVMSQPKSGTSDFASSNSVGATALSKEPMEVNWGIGNSVVQNV